MSRQHADPNNRFAVTQHHLTVKAALFGPPDGAELREAARGLDESCFHVFLSPVVFTDEADGEGEEYKMTLWETSKPNYPR